MSIEVGDKLRSTDARDANRVVRVIEIHRGITGAARKLRVESIVTERRTFLNYPLRGRWERME